VSATRLSPLDDSFLTAETPTAHMHVGWTAVFRPPHDSPPPSFEELRRHIEARLPRAPRYRQKLSPAPLELDAPSWIDDENFDVARHVRHARTADLDEFVADCMSRQLDRDRPLWEICVADRLEDGRIGLVGKAHHCMVDGIAAVELASLLLDPAPDVSPPDPDDWEPSPAPGTLSRLASSLEAKTRSQLELLSRARGLVLSPRRLVGVAGELGGAVGVAHRALRPAQPVPLLNEEISPRRTLARAERPLDDLRRIKRRYEATINDVYLAVAAGAMRRLFREYGDDPVPLKAMVPVSIRDDGEADSLGNRISFMFVDLPCDEADPERRLRRLCTQAREAKESGDPGTASSALDLIGLAPRPLQKLAARGVASPRMFNLVVSNIPGPREPMFMAGCELEEAYPVVPLADNHALSIGMTTVRERACFGIYADSESLDDVQMVADAVHASTDELLALA
jgi:diacylglycerol O-acyltransferase